jgi:hypothetical protein
MNQILPAAADLVVGPRVNTAPVIPRIRREWDAKAGRFVWQCSPLPLGPWGLGVSQQARYDWRHAEMWCLRRNAADQQLQPAALAVEAAA